MNPTEKAVQLFNTYYASILGINNDLSEEVIISILAKKQALIAVDEIYNGGLHLRYGAYLDEFEDKQNYYSYWEDVKKEINQLIIKNK